MLLSTLLFAPIAFVGQLSVGPGMLTSGGVGDASAQTGLAIVGRLGARLPWGLTPDLTISRASWDFFTPHPGGGFGSTTGWKGSVVGILPGARWIFDAGPLEPWVGLHGGYGWNPRQDYDGGDSKQGPMVELAGGLGVAVAGPLRLGAEVGWTRMLGDISTLPTWWTVAGSLGIRH